MNRRASTLRVSYFRRWYGLVFSLAAVAVGCHDVEHLLNGPPPTDARFTLTLTQTTLAVIRGSEQVITATVTRSGDYDGAVPITVSGLPPGTTAAVTNTVTSARTSTSTVTISVGTATPAALYSLTVHAHVDGIPDAAQVISLTVADPPIFALTPALSSVTVVRGEAGVLVPLTIATNNLLLPIRVVTATDGFTAAFSQDGTTTGLLTINVSSSITPGQYAVQFNATAAGAPSQSFSIAFTVSSAAVLIVATGDVEVPRGGSAIADVNVYHDASTAVDLSVEGLPAGVAGSFQPATVTGSHASLILAGSPASVPGTFTYTIRAKTAGSSVAAVSANLVVVEPAIALSAAPRNIALAAGSNAVTTLTISRKFFTGDVVITTEMLPTGITATVAPATVSGTTSVITIAAAASVIPGVYNVVVRATPSGLPSTASVTAPLIVTVGAPAGSIGNVVLDWTRCSPPEWVAGQDGAAPFAQLLLENRVAKFTVSSATGAFAYASSGAGVVVRYATRAELTAGAIDLCTAAPAKLVTGTLVQNGLSNPIIHSLGGASTMTTGTVPSFVLAGVATGPQDYVGYYANANRGLIRRDLDIVDGGSLGTVDLNGSEAFVMDRTSMSILGSVVAGESVGYSTALLTRDACIVNPLANGSFGTFTNGGVLNFSALVVTVPQAQQRTTDLNRVSLAVGSATGSRTTMTDYKGLPTSISTAPAFSGAATTKLAGSYARLETVIPSVHSAYNTSITLSYGSQIPMVVSATSAYAGPANVRLAMPDLSGVSGWKSQFALSGSASGVWSVTAVGSTGPACTNTRSAFTGIVTGSF